MLTPREKQGCEALLELLPDEELTSLAQTVTARQILLTNRKDAIDAVITFSQDASEFLKRKKVRREYLFRYMAQNRIAASPNSEKNQLVAAILKFWDSVDERGEDPQRREVPPERVNRQVQNAPEPAAPNLQVSCAQKTATDPTTQPMALAFASWFFPLWNAQNPSSQIASNEAFGPHHFYPDCRLKLLTNTTGISEDEFSGCELTFRRLLALVTEERLVFNPNVSDEGVKGKSEPHGLVMVQVCGVIHQEGNPVGIFEQQFGLISEPHTQNWKIKFINLKIGAGTLGKTPTLQDTHERLAITSS